MANISSQNPIRYALDILSTKLTGVISSAASYSVDLTRAQKVIGITVSGTQPSGTHRYIAFRISGAWGRLTSAGAFQAFDENSCTFDNLEANGNIPSDLTALTNIPALAGKTFGVAIALSSDDSDNALPTCGLSFSCQNASQQLSAAEYSPTYQLGDDAQIISIQAETECSAGGSVTIQANITRPDGTSSGWVNLETLSGEKASAIQLKGEYKASAVGTSRAQIKSVNVLYKTGSEILTGMSDGEIISLTQDWYMPVKTCRLTVRHNPLEQSVIKGYAAFRASPQHMKGEQLGVGSGSRKTFQLANTQGIKYDTFKLYYDGQQKYTDYELNTEAGRVTCTAPEGVVVSCDYDYGWDSETWQEMPLTFRNSYEDYDSSEFKLTDSGSGKSVAALKIVLGMTSGHIADELLGTASGKAKSFKLSRRVRDGNITVSAGITELSAKNWSLSDDGQYLTAAAPAGQYIRASYDWISETPKVKQFAAVFSE